MKEEPGNFYLAIPEPQRGALLALRNIILAHNPEISETRKYGMPCFLYRRKIMCYLWYEKKTGDPYILMADGNRLHNRHLERGDRTRMKILRLDPNADFPMAIIGAVLDEAIGLYEKGIAKRV